MAFNNNEITFGEVGLQGENLKNPTALKFSKSGNPTLFVTQQNAEIWRYELASEADGSDGDTLPQFKVTNAAKITGVALQTQNHNNDGSLNGTAIRQMTGLATTTDEDGNDVLYVNSSDWRIAAGVDSGLDTNSGQIHKLVLDKDTGEVLSTVAIIRGLSRSDENHSTNDPGERVFDIKIEGQEIFSDVDLTETYEHLTGAMFEYVFVAGDDSLDIEWIHEIENPTFNAIEIPLLIS